MRVEDLIALNAGLKKALSFVVCANHSPGPRELTSERLRVTCMLDQTSTEDVLRCGPRPDSLRLAATAWTLAETGMERPSCKLWLQDGAAARMTFQRFVEDLRLAVAVLAAD